MSLRWFYDRSLTIPLVVSTYFRVNTKGQLAYHWSKKKKRRLAV